jgi:hypothetical protein
MTTRATLAIGTTLLLLASSAGIDAGTGDKLTLRVTPNVSSAPSTVNVRAIIAPDADNRTLHIEADSGAFYRSSDVQLEGDKAPMVTEVQLKNLPSGEYTVVAVLRDRTGHETVARQTLMVLSRLGEP